MKRPIFLISFFSMNCAGSKFLTSPAMRQAKAVASNCSIREIPFRASRMALQLSSVPMPSGLSRPTPVTTTLRDNDGSRLAPGGLLLLLVLDVVGGVFYGGDLFGVFIRDINVERFFKGHDQLHDIERVRAKIIHEGGVVVYLAFVHPKLLHDDLLHSLFNRHESSPRISAKIPTNSLILAMVAACRNYAAGKCADEGSVWLRFVHAIRSRIRLTVTPIVAQSGAFARVRLRHGPTARET